MGILAVFDTFLLYRITEYRYGRNVAIIASILFAVMPFTWMIRRIFLETIQLPFMLTSILLILNLGKNSQIQSQSVQQKDAGQQSSQLQQQQHLQQKQSYQSEYTKLTLIISGIFLGLAIFTKIPAFTIIPLGVIMVYMVTRKKRNVIVWLIPVFLVPM